MSEVGESIPFGEAWLLVLELRKESGSHTHMLKHGFVETGSLADFAVIHHAEWYMNGHRQKNTPQLQLPRLWLPPDPNADVTPERRVELVAALESVSAFPGV